MNTIKAPLVIGQVVETARNGKAVIVAIYGEQRPQTIERMGSGAMITGGNASFDLIYLSGVRSNKVPECIICGGLPWVVLDVVVDQNDIDALINVANEREHLEAQESAAATAAYAIEKSRLRDCPEYQHLKKLEDNTKSEAALVAANIRSELKKNHPKTKFSVKKVNYNAVYIDWTDGPTKAEVESITNKYKSGRFNGMEDIYEYDSSPFNAVFGDVEYINTRRDFSDDLITKAISQLRERFGVTSVPECCNVEMYRSGAMNDFNRDSFHNGVGAEVRKVLWELKA